MDKENKVCTKAKGPNRNDCTACHENAELKNGTCVPKTGFYFDKTKSCGVFSKCSLTCKTCDGPLSTNCLTCDEKRTYDEATKTCNCKDGYGTNCDKCHVSCEKCVGPNSDDCLTCSSKNREF